MRSAKINTHAGREQRVGGQLRTPALSTILAATSLRVTPNLASHTLPVAPSPSSVDVSSRADLAGTVVLLLLLLGRSRPRPGRSRPGRSRSIRWSQPVSRSNLIFSARCCSLSIICAERSVVRPCEREGCVSSRAAASAARRVAACKKSNGMLFLRTGCKGVGVAAGASRCFAFGASQVVTHGSFYFSNLSPSTTLRIVVLRGTGWGLLTVT